MCSSDLCLAGEVAATHEVLHQPVLQRVVGDDHQPAAGAQYLPALFEGHFQCTHLPVDLDAQGLEEFR